MPAHDRRALIDQLRSLLTQQRYNPVVISQQASERFRAFAAFRLTSRTPIAVLLSRRLDRPRRLRQLHARPRERAWRSRIESMLKGLSDWCVIGRLRSHFVEGWAAEPKGSRSPYTRSRSQEPSDVSVTRLICFIWLPFSPSPGSGGKRPNGHSPSQWPA